MASVLITSWSLLLFLYKNAKGNLNMILQIIEGLPSVVSLENCLIGFCLSNMKIPGNHATYNSVSRKRVAQPNVHLQF